MKMNIVFNLLLLCLSSTVFNSTVLATELPIKKAAYYESGQLQKAFLTANTTVDSFLCKGWIRFFPNGSLKQFQCVQDFELQGIPIPANSFVFLRENGTLKNCWLAKKITIQGIPCPAGLKASTGFYENGNLSCCFPTEPVTVDGIVCKPGGLNGVKFYADGKLKQAWLQKTQTIHNVSYRKGTCINLDEQGQVVETRRKSLLEKIFPMFY